MLRDGIISSKLTGGSILDVGAGVGALAFELLDVGMERAVLVDATDPYLDAAKQEAARRNRRAATTFVRGDFVDVASDLPPADVVTLDRVVCCYPNYTSLLMLACTHARRAVAFSYPRSRWFVRCTVTCENTMRRVASNPFRNFVHPPESMRGVVREEGFELVTSAQTLTWATDIFVRSSRA